MIHLEKIVKTYRMEQNEIHALCGVDLMVKKGSVVAITGRSGSGKSTLLHIIGTLDRPTSGRLVLNDASLNALSDLRLSQFRNRFIGFVFQMNNLLPDFSALENVMMPGLIGGEERSTVAERAAQLLQSVGLGKRLKHRPSELSGGEQQRVAIARALVMQPPILLADEPTGNLDKRGSQIILELLLDLCQKGGVTMMLVTHDLELARQLPSSAVMEDGRIIDLGGAW